MFRLLRAAGLALALTVTSVLAFGPGPAAAAALKFPPLTGRVVDDAHILSPEIQADLTQKLQGLEARTHRQLVVATLSSLQGDDIEDYGYQLGRAWGIGQKGVNDGVILIVAPTEHKVRIEVGYGLEGVLTDALSSVIIQTRILPRFKAGDIPGGVVAGTDALIDQLALPDDQAKANIAAAESQSAPAARHRSSPISGIPVLFIILFIFLVLRGGGRRGRGGLGGALPWLLLGSMAGRRGGGWGDSGGFGGGGGGGGGFSGGGGGFGGGGASGGW